MSRLNEDVIRELEEMKKIGIRVPKAALAEAADPGLEKEYEGMGATELASLLIEVHA